MPIDIPEIFWIRLCNRRCVAFVGAGFSVPAGYPAWPSLISQLIEFSEANGTDHQKQQLPRVRALLAANLLPAAAHLLRHIHREDVVLRDCLRRTFSSRPKAAWPEANQMTARLQNLTAAPWAGIVTTNYDELIEPEVKIRRPIWIEVHGATHLLASALHRGVPFFVKLHGNTWDTDLVLSSDDYHRTYLSNSLVETFIESLMLNYHLVFIGSSVEDEILRIRVRLNYQFQRQIPTAYALLPSSESNRNREQMLRTEAGVEPFFYDPDKRHSVLDEFLKNAATCADPPVHQAKVALKMEDIGRINRKILSLISSAPNGTLDIRVFENSFTLFGSYSGAERQLPSLEHLSAFEIRARLEYLISLGLVALDGKTASLRVTA
jgi:hypothetical protein